MSFSLLQVSSKSFTTDLHMSNHSLRTFTCQIIHYGPSHVKSFTTDLHMSNHSLRTFTCQIIHYGPSHVKSFTTDLQCQLQCTRKQQTICSLNNQPVCMLTYKNLFTRQASSTLRNTAHATRARCHLPYIIHGSDLTVSRSLTNNLIGSTLGRQKWSSKSGNCQTNNFW